MAGRVDRACNTSSSAAPLGLNREATLPHTNLECGAFARRVADEMHGDGSVLQPQGQERACQAQRAGHAERAHRHDPGQRRVVGQISGGVHQSVPDAVRCASATAAATFSGQRGSWRLKMPPATSISAPAQCRANWWRHPAGT